MGSISPLGDGSGVFRLPDQRSRILSTRGARFTIMVAGESGLGKTTLINTLFASELSPATDYKKRFTKQLERGTELQLIKAELQEGKFRLQLNLIDTPGFGDYVNNRHCWTPLTKFIDAQLESYIAQEQQPQRKEKTDMRVHACLYFISPNGHTLKPLDIEVMKRLGTRVNLIPVIAKGDSLTGKQLLKFKRHIREVITAKGIRIYVPPVDSTDESTRALADAIPFSVMGSTEYVRANDGKIVRGREYAWGIAEVENEKHCDFVKLRSLLLSSHMLDLISSTEDSIYENFRQAHLKEKANKIPSKPSSSSSNPKFKAEEDELKKKFTDQVEAETVRFREWEEHLVEERDRLNDELERLHRHIKMLNQEVDDIEMGYRRSKLVVTGSERATSFKRSSGRLKDSTL